jgi:hypothetical protein
VEAHLLLVEVVAAVVLAQLVPQVMIQPMAVPALIPHLQEVQQLMQAEVEAVDLVQAQEVLVDQVVVGLGAQRREVLLLQELLIQVAEEEAVVLIPVPRMRPQLVELVVQA